GVFHAAERNTRVGSNHGIDERQPRFYTIDEHLLLRRIGGPGAGAQAKPRVVGYVDGVCHSAGAKDGGHRPEELVVKGGRAFRNLGQRGRSKEVSRTIEPRSAQEHASTHLYSAVHLLLQAPENILGGQRANISCGIHGIADLERSHVSDKLRDESVVNGLIDDKALGGDAGLAVIDNAGLNRGSGGTVKIRAGHYDEGVASAQFKHDLLDLPAGRRGHDAARAHAAGKGHGHDARISDDAVHAVWADEQGLKDAFRKAGPAEDFFDRQGALRNIGRMLQQADVARHQRGRGEAEDLPERKVPGHDRQDRADRLVADKAARGAGGGFFVGKKAFGVFRVKAAAKGALLGFLHGGTQSLAH